MRASLITRTIVIGIVGIILSGAFVLWPAHTRAAAAASAPSGDLPKLRQERIATLREASDLAVQLFKQGLLNGEEVHSLNRRLLQAELEGAGSPEQRVAILRKALEVARKQEEFIAQRERSGLVTPLSSLEAKESRLDVEIELAQATAQ
jgi:outer membrane protein TolC